MIFEAEELLRRAMEARAKAYAPYSRFKVGAALLTNSGAVYSGCNVENASYGLTICAERTAVVKAVSEGHLVFLAVALVGDVGEDYCSPCGACRQVLAEFSPDMLVVMGNLQGGFKILPLGDLLPARFQQGNLL